MTELMHQIFSRKQAWRHHLASLPVGEKMRMLEQMVRDTKAIAATHPPKPKNAITFESLATQLKKR